jgi:hypothetical protein
MTLLAPRNTQAGVNTRKGSRIELDIVLVIIFRSVCLFMSTSNDFRPGILITAAVERLSQRQQHGKTFAEQYTPQGNVTSQQLH